MIFMLTCYVALGSQVFSVKLPKCYLSTFFRDITSKTTLIGKLVTVHQSHYIFQGAQYLDKIIKLKLMLPLQYCM